jgi:hypothetical protein
MHMQLFGGVPSTTWKLVQLVASWLHMSESMVQGFPE